jgi:hypothetical protein
MVPIKKFLVGVHPMYKMFRVGSLSGAIADAVFALRSDKRLGKDYFHSVGFNEARDTVQLQSEDATRRLMINTQDVIFSKHCYGTSSETVSATKALEEFALIWPAVQRVLGPFDVRRIGVVGEVRVEASAPSKLLLDKFLKTAKPEYAAKARLRWELKSPLRDGTVPDEKTDAFDNAIYDFYDSVMDADARDAGAYNANLDFQRYYAPLLASEDVARETAGRLFKAFEERMRSFKEFLISVGLQ